MQVHNEAGSLWPTPTLTVFVDDAAQLNRGLARIILDEEKKIVSSNRPTAVAGIKEGLTAYWLKFNVLNWDYPEIREFRKIVFVGLRKWLSILGDPDSAEMRVSGISCWANVLRHGEGLTIHHHDPAFVSGHYTVQTGFEDSVTVPMEDSGHTIYFRPGFIDRSHGGGAFMAPSPWDDDWRIDTPAQTGRLFFFPSFVRHEVRPYLGPTQRISIAMDVFLNCQTLPIHFGGKRWWVPTDSDYLQREHQTPSPAASHF